MTSLLSVASIKYALRQIAADQVDVIHGMASIRGLDETSLTPNDYKRLIIEEAEASVAADGGEHVEAQRVYAARLREIADAIPIEKEMLTARDYATALHVQHRAGRDRRAQHTPHRAAVRRADLPPVGRLRRRQLQPGARRLHRAGKRLVDLGVSAWYTVTTHPYLTSKVTMNKQPIAVCYGMGVDSTAVLIGLAQRGIRPDLITFADTGGEKPETYLYAPIIRQWLRDVDFPQFELCRYIPPIAPYKSLYGNCIKNETIPSIAFGRKSCSLKWKRDAQEPLRRRLPANVQAWAEGKKVTKIIGFDATEKRRTYAGVGAEIDEYDYWYPLQDWGWDRERCEREIANAGLPVPVKSACFFCPSMKKHEITELREQHPDLYQLALDMEDGYRTGKHWRGEAASTVGLGRNFAWCDAAC
jgi:hypothetical protein